MWYIINELKEEPNNDWAFKYYIIGIDTTGSNEIRVFEFTEHQVDSRLNTIMDVLEQIRWHQANDKWEHTLEYYTGDGAEKLNL
jgi:hypothetical protein